MTTPNSIITPQTPKTGHAVTTTANTTYTDAPTNTQLLLDATAAGRVTRISAMPRATVTATMLQLYLSKDGGVTKRLINSKLMSAHTIQATTAIPATDFGYSDLNPMLLEAGDSLYVAQAVTLADGVCWDAEWAAY